MEPTPAPGTSERSDPAEPKPQGDTLADDEAARIGLFDEASPRWDEYEPYEGAEDMFGGNQLPRVARSR